MKILFISYDPTEVISYYRCAGVTDNLSKLTKHEITVMEWSRVPATDWAILMNGFYDVIFFSRPFTPDVLSFLSYAKDFGKKIWTDFDDNLLEVAPENKMYMTYSKEGVQKTIKSILTLSDVISVTNQNLKDVYSPYNANVHIVPNALNDDIFGSRILKPRTKTALWRGSDTHIYNLWSYGAEINKAIDEFPEWNFDFMGYYPWFLSEKKGYRDAMDIMGYHKSLLSIAPSFIHSPISNDSFNKCRSQIAVIEAAYCGAASIIPKHWIGTGEEQTIGTIMYSDIKSYGDALLAACRGDIDLEKQAKQTWEFVRSEWALSKINQKRLNIIKSLE